MDQEKIKLLYVDDENHNLESFKANFRKDFDILTTTSTEEGMKILDEHEVHVVIADQNLQGQKGVDFLEATREKHPETTRVLLSGFAVLDDLIDAVNKSNIHKFIGKPLQREKILQTCEDAYNFYLTKREQANRMLQLERTNQQLEFMLRERLIS